MENKKYSKDLLEKAAKCTTNEERMAFLKENNIELPDEIMNSISGGTDSDDYVCFDCGERFDNWWEYLIHQMSHMYTA
ncbi:MAG: C2H2-type zinc finger protein [Erysipelotrichaceae bacterium]|nr:C2H2-type zinc finger protein [Erysipelotrichaceae bacterium]